MKTDPVPGTRVRFGTFEADLRSGELRREGLKVKIQELPFQVLVLLLERPGEVVTREDLHGRLWPADTFVDFEQGLNKAINKLREALGDDANNPRFVETLTRRGYRFLGPVEHIDPASSAAVGEESVDGGIRAASSRRWVMVALAGALLVIAVVALAGWWRTVRNAAPTPSWSGEILPGPATAFWPRVSPNGHLIAFQAMVDNDTQVAVTDPTTGNWTVLTHDRTHGSIGSLCWSRDGSRIYFDRFMSQPRGIYSVPSLGGEERLVLANAAGPEPLPDGTMLLARVDPNRKYQIYHFWPDTGRLQALGVWESDLVFPAIRVFPEGREAVFFGTVKGEGKSVSHLYLLDITTGSARRLAPELPIRPSFDSFPLAVTRDGRSVLIDLPSGNLHRIVAIPRSGSGPARALEALTSMPWELDVAPDGSIYVDQVDRPLEILKLPQAGGTPEVLASSEFYSPYDAVPVELSDGRLLLPSIVSGRRRLLLGKPGGSFVRLIETTEETAPPMAHVGNNEVAFIVGSPPAQMLALASVKEGRILRRFKSTEGKDVGAVAASPDGKALYYASSGKIWSVPSQGGNPHEICAGDGVAADTNGRDLIVNLIERERVRLERVPLSGSPLQEIQLGDDLPLIPNALCPNAINKRGKLLVGVVPRDSWFNRLAILDLSTSKITQVPLNYAGDVVMPGWGNDGGILLTAFPMRAHIWRFRPAH
jgi:eukaryotic-like serine/threonine-protein kinase